MSSGGNKRSRQATSEDAQAPRNQSGLVRPAAAEGGVHFTVPVPPPREYDADGLLIIRPPPPINLRFGVPEPIPPPPLTAEERELEELWSEMEMALRTSEEASPEADDDESAQESKGTSSSTTRKSGAK